MMVVIPSPLATACFGVKPSMQLNVCDFLPLFYLIALILVHKGMSVLRNFDLEARPCGQDQFPSQETHGQDQVLCH